MKRFKLTHLFFLCVTMFLIFTVPLSAQFSQWDKGDEEDLLLEEKVRDALILSPEIFDAFLHVSVKDGTVYIVGRFLSEEERELAFAAIYRIPHVLAVKMNVEVRPLEAKDAERLKKVKPMKVKPFVVPTQFRKPNAPPPKTRSISDVTQERMSRYQKKQAEDNRIKRDVEFVIKLNLDMTRIQGIFVTVTEKVVTLTGVVADNRIKRKAESISREVHGVRDVKNHINVR